jgi:alanyl-tRNA synthetase
MDHLIDGGMSACVQGIDGAAVPAAAKAALRGKLAALQKRVLEDQKAAAADNKARATAAAVAAADAAAAAGQKYVVVQLEIGLDAKAALEAWNAIHKKHPSLPAAILTADQGEQPSLLPM